MFIATDDVCRERRRRKFANVDPFPPDGCLVLEETRTEEDEAEKKKKRSSH